MKKTWYTEAAYLLGIVILALGTALMEKADFGLSMVVAPAYLLHLKVSQFFPFFTFGMAEYCLQGVILVLLALVMRRFRLSYLFSFGTALLYGLTLDAVMALTGWLPDTSIVLRTIYYLLGMAIGSVGVSLFFFSYITPEAYELFVKELAQKLGKPMDRVKTVYDIVSCVVSIALSFAFFGLGHFEGIKWGTILCALINGTLIGLCSRYLTRHFDFADRLPWRKYFQ